MRLVRVLGVATVLALGVGCGLIEKMRPDTNKNKSPMPREVSSEQLVDYLNAQAARLESVTYDKATVTARQGLGLVPLPSLRGNLAAVQPHYFRMRGEGGAVNAKVDLGSNNEQFWLYLDAPTARQNFVFASHSDFESGRAKLPDGIPFEPDWVMQALGMTKFPREAKYDRVRVDDKARTYTLSWSAATPNGVPIRKEIVFSADDADSSRDQPQVKRHVIRDVRGNVVCSADIKKARTVSVGGRDAGSGHPFVVQYPLHIVLRWEQQRFEMELDLNGGQVNPNLTEAQIRSHFARPNIPGATPINLAEARFEAPGR
jgi:hypothetical protein